MTAMNLPFRFLYVICACTAIMITSASCSQYQASSHINTHYRNELAALWKMHKSAFKTTPVVNQRRKIGGRVSKENAVKEEINSNLKMLINQYGWPSYNLVGRLYSDRAIALIIYQRKDLKFQKRAISAIGALAKKDQASKSKYAYLYDLVMIKEGKGQRYGTQLEGVIMKDACILVPKPISDLAHIDTRRKNIGLQETESEYVKRANKKACPHADNSSLNVDYIKKLLMMYYEDQAARKIYVDAFQHAEGYHSIDDKTGRELKALIHKYGWPSYENVGPVADKAVVLFIHQDADLQFQQHALAVVRAFAEEGEIGWPGYAYLYDRVMVNEGNKQKYGTQGHCTESGFWRPAPMEAPEHVNERRAAVNLIQSNGTESEYIKSIEGVCRKHSGYN